MTANAAGLITLRGIPRRYLSGQPTKTGELRPSATAAHIWMSMHQVIKLSPPGLQGKYHEMSGTSMATSHVSGAIALLLAQQPGLIAARDQAALEARTAMPLRLQGPPPRRPGTWRRD